MAVATLPGRLVAVTGHGDTTVRIWDAATRALTHGPLTGHSGGITAVATGRLTDGRNVAVTADCHGNLLTWDLAAAAPIGEPVTVRLGVRALATAVLPDERLIALVTDTRGNLRRLDVAAGNWVGAIIATDTEIDCVATAVLPDGRLVAAMGHRDRPAGGFDAPRQSQAVCTVRVWDVVAGAPLSAPLEGHRYAVNTIAATTWLDGRPIAVSGSSDGTVRVWDLVTHTQLDEVAIDIGGLIGGLGLIEEPAGRLTAVTTSFGAHVWTFGDPAARSIDLPYEHTSEVAVGRLPDGRAVAVFGGRDGGIRTWDLAAGALL